MEEKTTAKKSLNTPNIVSKNKQKIMLIICLFSFVLLVLRLLCIQFVDGEHLTALAIAQQTSSEVISSKRGNIYDSKGASLAISETVDTISINPKKIAKDNPEKNKEYKELVAKGLSEIFDLDYDDVLKKVYSENAVETIIKKVEEDKVIDLKAWMKENKISVGINIDEDSKRYYPYSSVAAQVIGVCGTDNQGLSGIEHSYDSVLKGVSGQIITSIDATKGEIPNSVESFIEAEDGYNLNLTLDINIQRIVEKNLQEATEKNKCKKGANCLIMEPETGRILAMASYPTYDLNSPYTTTSYFSDNWDNLSQKEKTDRIYQMWNVRSVSEMYEPGSVFKLITAAVALEEGITTPNKVEFNCTGSQKVLDRDISCWYKPIGAHGYQNLTEALEHSCNPAFIQLGQKVGAKTLYKYYDAFGFFNKTNVGLSGEASGYFHELNKVSLVELATMSFGQRFTITPLQMATALCAISNGGYLMKPQIVKSITNTDTGEVIEQEPEMVRQVISSQTSEKMRKMMESVVINGTGKNAAVEGYSVGGISGTSEPNKSGNPDSVYVASFAAITPVENTKLVILVTLYAPDGDSHQGGTVAAPVVSSILSEVLPYLGIEPDKTNLD